MKKIWNSPFRFIHGAHSAKSILKQEQYPEVAFIGRSNVGKSSLINALTNQKSLCRTSKTPGRTQQINYFFNDRFYLVDLPGYGYAKISEDMRKSWNHLMQAYFENNLMLKHIFVLVDARRGLMHIDRDVLDYIQNFSSSIVITKADKVKSAFPDHMIITSATKREGLIELQKRISEYL